MTDYQIDQLKSLYRAVQAYLDETDVEDASRLFTELTSLVSKISKWINR